MRRLAGAIRRGGFGLPNEKGLAREALEALKSELRRR
jgi:hypothetical protein